MTTKHSGQGQRTPFARNSAEDGDGSGQFPGHEQRTVSGHSGHPFSGQHWPVYIQAVLPQRDPQCFLYQSCQDSPDRPRLAALSSA
jgi:hypothetical protein